MTWKSIPICHVCGRDMGGTTIDHTVCFDRASRNSMEQSPVKGMDGRARRVVIVDYTQDPPRVMDETAVWDVAIQDDGRTVKVFKLIDQQDTSEQAP